MILLPSLQEVQYNNEKKSKTKLKKDQIFKVSDIK